MPKRFFRSAAVVTACLGVLVAPVPAAFAFQTQPVASSRDQDGQLCTLSGTILSANTGEPLKKARVVLIPESENSDKPNIATTDEEGRFTISGIFDGRYHMWADRDGYESKRFEMGEAGRSSTIFTLKPGQKLTDIVIRLERYTTVSGCITDEDGDPVQRVQVQVVACKMFRGKPECYTTSEAETNDLGEYRAFNVRRGKYTVRALPRSRYRTIIGGVNMDDSTLISAGEYVQTYFPSVTDASRATTIELKSGDNISGIDISLVRERLYRVRGRVTNGVTGYPTGRVRVALIPTDPDNSYSSSLLIADADEKTGDFEIREVAEGGYNAVASWRDGENDFSGSQTIQVAGADEDSISILIVRGATIRGKVVLLGNATRARDIDVNIYPRDWTKLASRESREVKADGTFQITGVNGGLYDIDVNSSCRTCYTKAVRVSGEDMKEQGLTVSSAASTYDVEVFYSEGVSIVSGNVVDSQGTPSPGATVYLVADPPGQHPWRSHQETTDQSGHFVVARVDPGNYQAIALAGDDDSVDLSDPQFLQRYRSNAVAISIGENEKKSIGLTASTVPAANRSQ